MRLGFLHLALLSPTNWDQQEPAATTRGEGMLVNGDEDMQHRLTQTREVIGDKMAIRAIFCHLKRAFSLKVMTLNHQRP